MISVICSSKFPGKECLSTYKISSICVILTEFLSTLLTASTEVFESKNNTNYLRNKQSGEKSKKFVFIKTDFIIIIDFFF